MLESLDYATSIEHLKNRGLLDYDADHSGNMRFGHWFHICCTDDDTEKIRFEHSTYVHKEFDMNYPGCDTRNRR